MSATTLFLVRDPALREEVRAALRAVDPAYTLVFELDPARDPIAQIAELQPNLIVFDALALPPWTAEARSSPATRRLPALALGNDEYGLEREQARTYGISDFLTVSALRRDLPNALLSRARGFTDYDALQKGCAGPLSEIARQGLEEFNSGRYFDAHETLEHAWNVEPGPVRDVYRAVLQVAVTYYQIERGNYNGAYKMFLRMIQWFAPLPDHCQGIDISRLKADAAAVRAHLETLGPERIQQFDRALLKPVSFERSS